MELYHDPTSRSVRVRMALEELAIPYTLRLVSLAAGEHRTDSHRQRHPLAQLPVLVDGELVMIESAAICMYLAERYPSGGAGSGLAPAPGASDRPAYLQWCAFVSGSLEPAILNTFVQEQGQAALPGAPELSAVLDALSVPIGRNGQLLASGLSTPDVLVGPTLAILQRHGVPLPGTLEAYLARLRQRPSFVMAHSS